MRSPNNVLFTAVQALFDETLYPKCPNMRCLGYIPSQIPDEEMGEYNIPPDDENEEHGGMDLPDLPMPPLPGPRAPRGAP